MNKLFATLIAAAFVFVAASAIARRQYQGTHNNEGRAGQGEGRSEGQEASQGTTDARGKKAANAAKVKEEKQQSGGDSTQSTPDEGRAGQGEGRRGGQEASQVTTDARGSKAANAAKQNQSKESAKRYDEQTLTSTPKAGLRTSA